MLPTSSNNEENRKPENSFPPTHFDTWERLSDYQKPSSSTTDDAYGKPVAKISPTASIDERETGIIGSTLRQDSTDSDSTGSSNMNPYDRLDKEVISKKNAHTNSYRNDVDELEGSLRTLGLQKVNAPTISSFSAWKSQSSALPAPSSSETSKIVKAEIKAPQQPMSLNPNYFDVMREMEKSMNIFTKLFRGSQIRNKNDLPSGRHLVNYRQNHAFDFAAMSHIWKENKMENLPKLPHRANLVMTLPSSRVRNSKICAFYRVLEKKEDKYILVACHVNIHGFHRGDLRFVEVNNRTVLKGFERSSVIGHLFLGDILTVTELTRCNETVSNVASSVEDASPDAPCQWMASKVVLFPRHEPVNVQFKFTCNGMASVVSTNEPMSVILNNLTEAKTNVEYTGIAFKSASYTVHTEDYTKKWYERIQEEISNIMIYPKALSTIYQYEEYTPNFVVEKQEQEEHPYQQDLEDLDLYRQHEMQTNVFTKFFDIGKSEKRKFGPGKSISNCRHSDAIDFAAMSYIWKNIRQQHLPKLPKLPNMVLPLPTSMPLDSEICAFYRVLVENKSKYILIACHMNVHGYHRGDLRFLEINESTKLYGFEGRSVIGQLFLGDIVAVTELARCNGHGSDAFKIPFDVSMSSQNTCTWMASKITLPSRPPPASVLFSFMKNRMAVVKGCDEPMNVEVKSIQNVEPDLIYKGTAFKPEKPELNFTEGFIKKKRHQIGSITLRIASYPNSFGTIYNFQESDIDNEHYKIGINAFSEEKFTEISLDEREKIVETCSLMGFSAANTIFNGRFDCRAFKMEEIKKNGMTVMFCIENPTSQPTLGLWCAGNRIVIGGPNGDVNGAIETVIDDPDIGYLRIAARLSRDIPKKFSFKGDGEFFVSQREVFENEILDDGYFKTLDPGCNGRRIIETLYGGKPLERVVVDKRDSSIERMMSQLFGVGSGISEHKTSGKKSEDTPTQFYFPSTPEPLALNKYQCEYVQMLLDGNPLIIGSSPFGCGKSMTIITAALELYKLKKNRKQLLITQSNYASVNLIDIAQRVCLSGDDDLKDLKFVRFVSEKNWNELPSNCRTDSDMPYLMNKLFKDWAMGRIDLTNLTCLKTHHYVQMVSHIIKNDLVNPMLFGDHIAQIYDKLSADFSRAPHAQTLVEAFFMIYKPDLVMVTADSAKGLLNILRDVCAVQIDEASQLAECTLLGLLKSFNNASFGLIGDIHQLPPYCEEGLEGKLKDFGIGNTMERAIKEKMFPVCTLRNVYRCHPKTTELLSELFYDGALVSGVSELARSDFMTKRDDFWPNPKFPMMFVNNTGASTKMGTSTSNSSEKSIVGEIVQNLINDPRNPVNPSDIGVISFYSAQTSILTEHLRGSGVKCGTVDAFQGSEKEIIIMCSTNERISDFMQLSNRLNVAMSRAKQVTIIIGHLDGLRRANYWSTIVNKIEQNGNLVNANDWYQNQRRNKVSLSSYPLISTSRQSKQQRANEYNSQHKHVKRQSNNDYGSQRSVTNSLNPEFVGFQKWDDETYGDWPTIQKST
ncbi:DNA2/NAM7 helicase-like C-terminal domain-containing protein [Caenorhabditis elegans]|uniref:DNA2/NAM7 helicase-like C-terminal domain-containing protein n=1 Tax=Caenorhabditis elegans TaxID=6239 RepID=Q95ZZ3_CAEEL|nr:DNA2/NAM7 helicase-like C-terminal domain-containing protein [Caenorhabditis elegans]CAC42246.2 DNA2/NAM7 helicase-like C-terminal domain-containing protein [Caenorhabditis elegans]